MLVVVTFLYESVGVVSVVMTMESSSTVVAISETSRDCCGYLDTGEMVAMLLKTAETF